MPRFNYQKWSNDLMVRICLQDCDFMFLGVCIMEDNAAATSQTRRRIPVVQESIVTEGDLQMKQLVLKQMSTDVTLQGLVTLFIVTSKVLV